MPSSAEPARKERDSALHGAQLPSGWSWSTLDEVCAGIFDCPHSTPKFTTTGPYVVRTQDITAGVFRPDNAAQVSERTYLERTARVVPSTGDLVYSREGTYFGVAAEVPDNQRICLGQRMVLLRPAHHLAASRYVRLWLNSPFMALHIAGYRDGSVAERLNLPTIRGLPVLLPSLPEQRGIADVLGALGDKIEVNRRMAAQILRVAEASYLNETAGYERTIPLRETGAWLSGGTPSTIDQRYWHGDVPWISSSSLKSFFLASSERMVTDLGVESGTRLVPTGSVLFIVRGMSLKTEFRVGIAQRPLTFGQDTKAILPDPAVGSATLGVALFSLRDEVLTLVDESGHGTGRLSTDRLERLAIPLPPVARAAEVEHSLATLVIRGAKAERENSTLGTLRDALLPKLLSGQVRVQEAEKLAGEAV